jgi:competence protein ComEC
MIPKPFEITFLDVKQGDCAFIRTDNNKKILIDGGGKDPKLNSGTDIGESTVVPLILDKGTKHIDIVVATHGHDDHTQGLDAVIDNIDVGMVIIPNTNGKGFERLLAG